MSNINTSPRFLFTVHHPNRIEIFYHLDIIEGFKVFVANLDKKTRFNFLLTISPLHQYMKFGHSLPVYFNRRRKSLYTLTGCDTLSFHGSIRILEMQNEVKVLENSKEFQAFINDPDLFPKEEEKE
jgi:hypothetical protein